MRFTTQRKVRSPRVMMVREVRTSIPLGTYRSGTSQLKAMSETFSRLRTIPRTLTAAAARTSLPFRSRTPWAKRKLGRRTNPIDSPTNQRPTGGSGGGGGRGPRGGGAGGGRAGRRTERGGGGGKKPPKINR